MLTGGCCLEYLIYKKIPSRLQQDGIYIYIGASSEAGRNPIALKPS